jgi:glyoxylase-like metal-dependent hydrolase (beta-lactamase superfamily II)
MKSQKGLKIKNLGDGIYEIDTYYLQRDNFTACYFIEHKGEIGIIETNTNHAVPIILESLKTMGFSPDQVKYIVVSHIHLDHAGGAGKLMLECPQAKLLVHQRGIRHLVAPEKLIASVKQVYGEEKYQQLYGDIVPVEQERIVVAEEGGRFSLGNREFLFFETPGHAKHHVVVLDNRSLSLFSGDAFGLSYPRFIFGPFRLAFPSTSPTQFEPEIAKETFKKMKELKPSRILLTHYGSLENIQDAYSQLNDWIDYSQQIAVKRFTEGLDGDELIETLRDDIWVYFDNIIKNVRGSGLTGEDREYLFLDAHLNAMGLSFYAHTINK